MIVPSLMVVLVFFFRKNMNDFICHHGASSPLVFQLYNTSVLSLHHVYCAVLSSFTMDIILY